MQTRNMWLPDQHPQGFIFTYKGKKYEVLSQSFSIRPGANFPLSHWYTVVKEIE